MGAEYRRSPTLRLRGPVCSSTPAAEGVWRNSVEVVADPGEVLEVVGAWRGGAFDFHCDDGAVGALDHEVDFATGAVAVMVEVQRFSAG